MASSIATTAKTVLFGDFSRFIIRDVANVRLMRLDERYADYDQTGFIAFSRHDSVVLDAGSNPIKHLVQA
jgi:HK97 family phage major capsid protein